VILLLSIDHLNVLDSDLPDGMFEKAIVGASEYLVVGKEEGSEIGIFEKEGIFDEVVEGVLVGFPKCVIVGKDEYSKLGC